MFRFVRLLRAVTSPLGLTHRLDSADEPLWPA